jgi:hypothetical protein
MTALDLPFGPRFVRRGARLLRLAPVVLALALATCTTTPNILPTNDFNRPTDVAFMCFGAFDTASGAPANDGGTPGALEVSGRPMRACHPQDQYDPGATTTTRTFAFLPNSAAGTLSVDDVRGRPGSDGGDAHVRVHARLRKRRDLGRRRRHLAHRRPRPFRRRVRTGAAGHRRRADLRERRRLPYRERQPRVVRPVARRSGGAAVAGVQRRLRRPSDAAAGAPDLSADRRPAPARRDVARRGSLRDRLSAARHRGARLADWRHPLPGRRRPGAHRRFPVELGGDAVAGAGDVPVLRSYRAHQPSERGDRRLLDGGARCRQ